MLTREKFVCLTSALACLLIGYAGAQFFATVEQRKEAPDYSAGRVLYFTQILKSMGSGDMQVVRVALVNEAETALEELIEEEKRFSGNRDNEIRLKILKDYKNIRESNPEFFMPPPQLQGAARDEWVERQKVLSEFLSKLGAN